LSHAIMIYRYLQVNLVCMKTASSKMSYSTAADALKLLQNFVTKTIDKSAFDADPQEYFRVVDELIHYLTTTHSTGLSQLMHRQLIQHILGSEQKQSTLFDQTDDHINNPLLYSPKDFITIHTNIPFQKREQQSSPSVFYSFSNSPFGKLLAGFTGYGLCHLSFITDKKQALNDLMLRFPHASLSETTNNLHRSILEWLQFPFVQPPHITLDLHATPFQLQVWDSLLEIPYGHLSSYTAIATRIGMPGAYRAVGTAIGSNPIAWLIPCHRVVKSDGNLSGYRWGKTRKAILIAWEHAVMGFNKGYT